MEQSKEERTGTPQDGFSSLIIPLLDGFLSRSLAFILNVKQKDTLKETWDQASLVQNDPY